MVEDSQDDIDLTDLALAELGIDWNLVVARDGLEAVRFVFGAASSRAATNELPQLVLLDVNLPKVSGLEVLGALKADARTRCLPVVMLSTSEDERDLSRSYALGANGYVRKPLDFDEYCRVLKEIAVYWLSTNRMPSRPRM